MIVVFFFILDMKNGWWFFCAWFVLFIRLWGCISSPRRLIRIFTILRDPRKILAEYPQIWNARILRYAPGIFFSVYKGGDDAGWIERNRGDWLYRESRDPFRIEDTSLFVTQAVQLASKVPFRSRVNLASPFPRHFLSLPPLYRYKVYTGLRLTNGLSFFPPSSLS